MHLPITLEGRESCLAAFQRLCRSYFRFGDTLSDLATPFRFGDSSDLATLFPIWRHFARNPVGERLPSTHHLACLPRSRHLSQTHCKAMW